MILRLLYITVAVLTIFLSGTSGASRLEGCANPGDIATALAKLERMDWRNVSLAELRTVWPTTLDGLNCDAAVCHSAWSKDRIISGHCQCCSTFSFKIDRNASGSQVERLDEIIINYSAVQRDELVATAKGFARASGLKESEVATLGRESVQNFHWEKNRGKERDLFGIEVRFTRAGNLWELFFNSGRNAIEPLGKWGRNPFSI